MSLAGGRAEQPFLEGLMEPFDFALGLGMFGTSVTVIDS
jgi:hypothetical protein